VSARRVRGLSLVASLLLGLVVPPLAALSLLPWWSVLVVVATLMADVISLRRAAVSGRAAGRAQALARRSAAGHTRSAAGRPTYFDAESESRVELESRVESDIESEYDAETPYDSQAPVAGAREIAQPIGPPADVDPSGWAPVPVPPPTYTLKAKAADPVPAQVTDLAEEESWSLDGMVYDCDLDELVQRRSATGA
jgi:hypothetical protein